MPFSKDDTTKPIPFRLVDDLDAKTGLTGKAGSISVEVSKAGSSVFSSGGGSVGEIGKGWYEYTPTASEMDTAGFAKLYADDAAAAAPANIAFSVVDNDAWGVYRADNRDGEALAAEGDYAMVGTIDPNTLTPSEKKIALDSGFPSRDGALEKRVLEITHADNDIEPAIVLAYTGSTRVCELRSPLKKVPAGGETVKAVGAAV